MDAESKNVDKKFVRFITIIAVLTALSGYLHHNYVTTASTKDGLSSCQYF
jgi:hypothetical protein